MMIAIRALCVLLVMTPAAVAQIKASPPGVNVNMSGATTAFLTFGGLNGRIPAEAFWCGELINAAPDIGQKPNPATIFGSLPLRYDLSSRAGDRFTDIMSIPASVARRAYQAAQNGSNATFFYVRRFIDPHGGPDEYVAVTCHLTAGGARSPLALLDVQFMTATGAPVILVEKGLPPEGFEATIRFSGTGNLRGRWELVRPGEELPTDHDLLTEATLPIEERGGQKRYLELERFNLFLPPTGSYTLHGPSTEKIPFTTEGSYLVLLRIEATDDKEGDSDFGEAGAGSGIVHAGGVAGFPMPVMRYAVGSLNAVQPSRSSALRLKAPDPDFVVSLPSYADLSWEGDSPFFKLEIVDGEGTEVLSALMPGSTKGYRVPGWVKDKTTSHALYWRLVSIDDEGTQRAQTEWRRMWIVR